MSFSIKFGNFLYNHAFPLYKPMYWVFKNRQDKFEIGLLRNYIKKGDIVLDIGSNIGFYAGILASFVGDGGTVHCFEPDIKNFQYLVKQCGNDQRIVLNNKAVGPKTETLKIYTSKKLNVDHRTYKPEKYDQVMEIPAVSIDDYIGATKVDLIKMDIQGFEMQAIQGMLKTIEKNDRILIFSEFWPYGLRKAGSSVTEYYNFLLSKKFNCYLLEDKELVLLNHEKVAALEPFGEEHYFNIVAKRDHV